MHATRKGGWLLFAAAWLALAAMAQAQRRPYLGYVYPAGGQQGTTFEIKLGGQELDGVQRLFVTGDGVSVRLLDFQRKLGPQEIRLLREQQQRLREGAGEEAARDVGERVSQRLRDYVQTPACAAIASIVRAEVTIQANAPLGARELRLVTARGVSNPLVFHVAQLPERSRPAMRTAPLHVLGKEALALRRRAEAEAEVRIALPCTVNGQIAAREANRYRFPATKGQWLVIAVQARQLIPYVADAVPGWFQPVLTLYDGAGREVGYADDFRFQPDPVLLYQVQQDGEHVIEIRDSLYRGREDFIYRIAVGEIPYVTSVFPLGTNVKQGVSPRLAGWNLEGAKLGGFPNRLQRGTLGLAAQGAELESNRVLFAASDLPEVLERESGEEGDGAQALTLPVIVNGRIGRAGDRDEFRFEGKAGEAVVIEVLARRLDSPLDSVVTLADANGNVIAANDDREDVLAGANTHHADSQLTAKLPADGSYFVQVTDTARQGGEEYGYRLRVSAPRADFELRVVPSSVSLPMNGSAAVTVHVRRLDGFAGAVRIGLERGGSTITAQPVTVAPNQTSVRLNLKGGGGVTNGPVALRVYGAAKIGGRDVVRAAVAAEDRMQAFLWRHLVPAGELLGMTYDPRAQLVVRRPVPERTTEPVKTDAAAAGAAEKPKFTKQQIAGRLRQLKLLYEEGLLTEAFYFEKVAECETAG